jgi:hypothetical protein
MRYIIKVDRKKGKTENCPLSPSAVYGGDKVCLVEPE